MRKELSNRQIDQYKYTDQDKDTMNRITRLSTWLHQENLNRGMSESTIDKLLAPFANAI